MTRLVSLLLPALLLAPGGRAGEGATPLAGNSPSAPDAYEIGGPEGVAAELTRNAEARRRVQPGGLKRALDPYFRWQEEMLERHGLTVGMQFYSLYQNASSSLAGQEDEALGSIFRFQGKWTLYQQEDGDLGRIEYRFENRSGDGGLPAPGSLGTRTGIAALSPGFAYSEGFDLDLSVLNWTQGMKGATLGYAVGRLAFDVYLDAFPFQTFSRGLINRSFILNPTMPTTGIGALGAVVKGFTSDNVWLGAQILDASARSGHFDWDTVRDGAWIKAVEIGLTPTRKDWKRRLVQLTYWQKDAVMRVGSPPGHGWALSAAYQVDEHLFPFLRFGRSDGGGGVPAESAFSAGLEYTPRPDRVWTLAAGWARPSERTYGPGLERETVLEASYKMQLAKNFFLTPDIQYIHHPARSPTEGSVWVTGLRVLLTL